MRVGARRGAANAGIMASRNGSAMAVPMPRSTARRESRLLGFMGASSRGPSQLEGAALNDSENEGREFVVGGGAISNDVRDCGCVRRLETAPEGEGQKLFGEIARERPRLRTKDGF